MEKDVDSTNDEWIVDGDLYLIKTISRYPILWDRKNFDSDQRNEVWLKLSKKLNIKLEWMKKRWSYLREQYVRHLKQINNLESDKPSKKNYKYFNEMSFLADHIQIRNGTFHQGIVSQITYQPITSESNGTIESIHRMEEDKYTVVENVDVDFVITENEIEAYNDDDDENLFVELSDEENGVKQLPTDNCCHNMRSTKNSTESVNQIAATKHEKMLTSNTATKPIVESDVTTVFEDVDSLETGTPEEHLSTDNADAANENYQKIPIPNDSRCEDVIFGELVTSMLKKMDSPNRKRAKKEILNILLS